VLVDLLANLNDPQRQAVTHVDGPLLVLAGPGSGKTRVITRRVAYLVGQGIAPWNVLAITFTNKAAREMRLRVESLQTPGGSTICTFHSLCARLLREFASEAGFEASFTIYDRDDQLRAVKDALARAEIDASRISPSRALGTISNAKNELLTPAGYEEKASDFYARRVAKVYSEYQRILRGCNAMDFDDLLMNTAFLLRSHPPVRELLSSRYRYVMIDEYQDTNRVQYLLAHGIAMDHENICVTGDPDQSIYAWRGADVRNILEFERDYPDAVVVRLEENYRSVQPILSVADTLIAHNTQRKDKALWTSRQGGRRPRAVYCQTERDEAEHIAAELLKRRDAGLDLADVAVFYRVNALSRVLEEHLVRKGLAYRVARGVAFYGRKEIKDVLAYVRLVANPADDISCLRIINTPTRGIGKSTVAKLVDAALAREMPVLEAARDPEAAGLSKGPAAKVSAFAALIDSLRDDLDRPPAEVIDAAFEASGLQASHGDDEEGLQARANVGELVSAAREYEASADSSSLADFLQHVGLISDVDTLADGAGAVTLMTLHAAKGLEFPCVYMMGMEEGMLPFARRTAPGEDDGVDVEEERRLAFVGITRARDELTFTLTRRRMVHGRTNEQAASRFLGEIGDGHLEVVDETAPVRRRPSRSRAGGFYDDVDLRRRIERMDDVEYDVEMPEFPIELEGLAPGRRVYHETFGQGKVLKLSGPWPQTRAQVQFEVGIKKLVLAKANVQLL
jgi:DNA helicase-2/ATP-dependent DNA helicase PcrA